VISRILSRNRDHHVVRLRGEAAESERTEFEVLFVFME
jgi:hypothetical protein